MAATSSRRPAALLVLVAAAAAVVALAAAGDVELLEGRYPPLAPGLSFDFYKKSCPKAESIVKEFLSSAVRQNVGLAAALIRLHFHDCFFFSSKQLRLRSTEVVAGVGAIPKLAIVCHEFFS
ncbi:unnamed protein product [Miscanthus lutarioriparius]|uniref:Plant heme peroxidase family profile domain-containing protein n=1 Tax=Miscanthus lutarioriparius TaxID=422564 RepID=A0A811P5S8_9POAL|nr:unnamed protein product [Miscanthus lutarioriparius]